MKKTRQKGFVLILVITAMAIIGLEMHVLTGGANTMLFQSDTAYLKACERNLVTSGLAWAKQNIRNNSRETFEKTVELDVSKMPNNAGFRLKPAVGGIRGSTLIVTIRGLPTGEEPQAQISTRVSRGRRTLRGDGKYKIRL
jgi:type II secretory pathway component PulK